LVKKEGKGKEPNPPTNFQKNGLTKTIGNPRLPKGWALPLSLLGLKKN